jgi:hypothetical protein
MNQQCTHESITWLAYVQVFKKPDPKELVRKWQADLRAEQRKIDRQIRGGAAAEEPLCPHMTCNQPLLC